MINSNSMSFKPLPKDQSPKKKSKSITMDSCYSLTSTEMHGHWSPRPPWRTPTISWTPNLIRCAAQHPYKLELSHPCPMRCLDGGRSIAQHLNTIVGSSYVFELWIRFSSIISSCMLSKLNIYLRIFFQDSMQVPRYFILMQYILF